MSRLRKVLLNILLLCSVSFAMGQKPIASPKKVIYDSSKVDVKPIDKAALNELKKQKEFIYTETPPEGMSLWDRFWNWVWEKIGETMQYANNNVFIKYLLIALFAGLILYTVYRIVWKNNMLVASTQKNIIDYEVMPDDIHLINYEQEIANLIKDNNFRLAIRLLYLKSLKQLSDKKVIDWQPGKTNYAYVNEVQADELRNPFKVLTKEFDYIWYGHFPIDAEDFEPLHQSFISFNKMIK